jgi:CRP-like cAMP-binding protein
MQILEAVKGQVPLLRDMDSWSFALLSCKVFLKAYLPDSLILRRGDPSEFAYIVLGGTVKVTKRTISFTLSFSKV